MASPTFFDLMGADYAGSVLQNLQTASPTIKASLNNTLDSALQSKLSSILPAGTFPVLSGLVDKLPAADFAAVSNLSVQAFVKQQLGPLLPADPAAQQAADSEIAKLSDTTTIGDLLQLNMPLGSNPLFSADVTKAGFASLLATSPSLGPNQQLQADLINRYLGSAGSIQDFWSQLSADPEFKAALPEIQFTLQLGTLTLNNSPLVAALRKQYQPQALQALISLTASNWTQLIVDNNVVIPASITGNTSAQKIANYVSTIMGSLQSAFPSDYMVEALTASPIDKFDQQVAQFLKNTPAFNLVKINLQQYLNKNPDALTGIADADKSNFLKRVSGYQRLARVNPDAQVMTALMSKGLDSAYKIASRPRAAFLTQFSPLFGDSDKAEAVYSSARSITASALNLYTSVHEGLSNNHPQVFGNVSEEVAAAIKQVPNWQELFGPTSYCTCQDCRSVLSAAAYLADLLHLLSAWQTDPTNQSSSTLLQMLNLRRPDLANIKLNCENTNTTLPYLDLVNEILETVVAAETTVAASNGVIFTVATGPAIASALPITGSVGTSVTITGVNFGATQGASTVTFNGVPATPTSWTDNQIVVAIPTGAATGDIVVTVAGDASNGMLFTVTVSAEPAINEILPAGGPVGSFLEILGTNFGAMGTITVNGVPATSTAWLATLIYATVPSGATTGNVVVTVGGVASNGVNFTVFEGAAPVIFSVSPPRGPTGTSVTISGANFGVTQGPSGVTFGGVPATPLSWSSTQIVVSVPAVSTTGNVVVGVKQPPTPVAYNTSADAKSDELSVNPEYTRDAAYVPLANAFYPFSLPFDRFLSIARSYLEFAGTGLYNVMKTFQIGVDPVVPANSNPNPTPSDQAIALEYLNISLDELLILTGQPFQGTSPLTNPNDLARYYGEQPTSGNVVNIAASPAGAVRAANIVTITTSAPHNFNTNDVVMISQVADLSFNGMFVITSVPSATTFTYDQLASDGTSGGGTATENWYTDLASADNFLQQTGVSFQDLVNLLETHFLNPSQSITLQTDPENPCDIDTIAIANLARADTDGDVDFTALKKFYRFIRLYTKFGWQISDLDKTLTALGATDINPSFLLQLSQMKQIQDALTLTPVEILGLWTNLDTEGSGSLYLSLFQNKGTVNPLDTAFTLRYTTALPASSTVNLSFLTPYGAQVSFSGGQLEFSGNNGQPMTANQERYLLSCSTDPNYQQAVAQLFIQSENTAPLVSLPAGLTLPAQLPDAIYYQGNQLYFIGQMSDQQRTQLKTLSTDQNYQLAIDNLYDMRWAAGTEIAIATQSLASQPGQLIPAQMIPAHPNTLLAALRISAIDLAAIIFSLWGQSAPPKPVVTVSNTGGTLATGTYYVIVTVVDQFGEWLYSNESAAIEVTGPSGSIGLTWTSVAGATLYRVYYTSAGAGAGNETLKISSAHPNTTITTTVAAGAVSTGTAPVNLAFPLNLANLSAVYRYSMLASALGISALDLLSLIQLIGINPFQPSTRGTPGAIEFVHKAQKVLQSKVSVAQLNYLYRNIANPSAGFGPRQADLDQFVSSLQSALNAPPTETSTVTDPAGSLLQEYLQAVLTTPDVSHVTALLNGSIQYSATLSALPPITFPDSLAGLIAFNQATGQLTFTGPMSVAQEIQFLALSRACY